MFLLNKESCKFNQLILIRRYIPTILENLKFSWIQWITLFIPAYLICERIIGFAFKNKIFATQEVADITKKFD